MKKTLNYDLINFFACDEIKKAHQYLKDVYNFNEDDIFIFEFSKLEIVDLEIITLIHKIINKRPKDQLSITRQWLDDNYFMVPVEQRKQLYLDFQNLMKVYYMDLAEAGNKDFTVNHNDVDDTGRPRYETTLSTFREYFQNGTRLLENIKPLFEN